jgi:hypothetical protein
VTGIDGIAVLEMRQYLPPAWLQPTFIRITSWLPKHSATLHEIFAETGLGFLTGSMGEPVVFSMGRYAASKAYKALFHRGKTRCVTLSSPYAAHYHHALSPA